MFIKALVLQVLLPHLSGVILVSLFHLPVPVYIGGRGGGQGGREVIYIPYWFSLNNSEMVKAITLVFYSIPQHFIRDTCAKFRIPNLPQSPDIWENSDRGISDFWISGLSPIKENCHNSRTSNDIDMNIGPVTKLGKRNTAMPK